jgi:hypothetical protein
MVPRRRPELSQKEMAFYVKWKGYPETENSWVREDDATYVSPGVGRSFVLMASIRAGARES